MLILAVCFILYHNGEKIKAILMNGEIVYFNKIQVVMFVEMCWRNQKRQKKYFEIE